MKTVIKITLGIIILWCVVLLFNFFLMTNNTKPIIVFNSTSYEYEGYTYHEYISLGYKVILKEQGWLKESKITFIWTENIPDMKFIIHDNTEPTSCVEKPFYETEHYEYYFDCYREITIEKDGQTYSVVEALDKNIITMEELSNRIEVIKEPKKLVTYELSSSSCNIFSENPSYLKQLEPGLATYCLDKASVYVNSEYYSSIDKAYNNVLTFEEIILEMNIINEYENGAKMYTDKYYYINVLECPNKNVVIGNSDMVYYDFMCN